MKRITEKYQQYSIKQSGVKELSGCQYFEGLHDEYYNEDKNKKMIQRQWLLSQIKEKKEREANNKSENNKIEKYILEINNQVIENHNNHEAIIKEQKIKNKIDNMIISNNNLNTKNHENNCNLNFEKSQLAELNRRGF